MSNGTTTPASPTPQQVFTNLSVALTGFDRAELAGTGLLGAHYDTLLRMIGEREAGHLLQAAADALAEDQKEEKDQKGPKGQKDPQHPKGDAFKKKVVENKRYGPVVVSLIKLWYLGSWYPLSGGYRDAYGSTADDVEHVVSDQAYREGLVWAAAGAHPLGAKPPGFGSWSEAPYLPPIS